MSEALMFYVSSASEMLNKSSQYLTPQALNHLEIEALPSKKSAFLVRYCSSKTILALNSASLQRLLGGMTSAVFEAAQKQIFLSGIC